MKHTPRRHVDRPPAQSAPKAGQWFLPLALWAIAFLVYSPVRECGFVDYDDPPYVIENPVVQAPLSTAQVAWAFTTDFALWHPLTWLSHMLDWDLFGPAPAGHHWVSVFCHASAAVLLYWALRSLTGWAGRSFVIALLFLVHPLNVESVAWVAERKTVLSGFFWMLCLLCYVAYVRSSRWSLYAATVVSFALGLMAKPAIVTLPFVLLLLDWWPLRRLPFSPGELHCAGGPAVCRAAPPVPPTWRRVIWEKVPLWILGILSVFMTLLHRPAGYVTPSASLGLRLENACLSYALYLKKLVWPQDLYLFYPFPREIAPAVWICSLALALAISALAVALRRSRPYVLVGWLWFLGVLVPMLGIVQAGDWPAMADRYAYLPAIGIFLGAVCAGADWLQARRCSAFGQITVAALCVGALVWSCQRQIGCWKSTDALWSRAIAVHPANATAHLNLGVFLAKQGQAELAATHLQEALRFDANLPEAHSSLAYLLTRRGQNPQAYDHAKTALRLNPGNPEALLNVALSLQTQGQPERAVPYLLEAVRADASNVVIRVVVARGLVQAGKLPAATTLLEDTVRLDANLAEAFWLLTEVQTRQQNLPRAAEAARQFVKLQPGNARGHYTLAALLSNMGDRTNAAVHLRRAAELDPALAGSLSVPASARGRGTPGATGSPP